MKEDCEGFTYPTIDTSKCINCNLCETICPIKTQKECIKPRHIFAAQNRDEYCRMKSSSGGIFTLLATEIIDKGGVVFGVRHNNGIIEYTYSTTKKGCEVFRGSKYIQAKNDNCYLIAEKFLKKGMIVLYTGTPCQISGLKSFLRKEYENLITVDFICHGVSNQTVFNKYINDTLLKSDIKYEDKKYTIKHLSFRDKTNGWTNYCFNMEAIVNERSSTKKIIIKENVSKNIFLRGYNKNLYLRPSCGNCPNRNLNSGSDITIADFWGIWNIYPQIDDDKGTSCVTINTIKGEVLYNKITSKLKYNLPVNLKQAFTNNNIIASNSSIHNKNRQLFFSLYKKENLYSLIPRLTKDSSCTIIKELIKKILYHTRLLKLARRIKNKIYDKNNRCSNFLG